MKNFQTLEVGKTYKNRNGVLVTISCTNSDPNSSYAFFGDNELSYTPSGEYWLEEKEDCEDLIELVHEHNDILTKYSEELDLFEPMTLLQLIDSHRSLREERLTHNKKRDELIKKYREIGRQQGYESVTNGEYVKVSELKKMTIQDFVNFIGESE